MRMEIFKSTTEVNYYMDRHVLFSTYHGYESAEFILLYKKSLLSHLSTDDIKSRLIYGLSL